MANRQSHTRRLKAAGMLLLCVMLSAAMLFSRLVVYTKADTRQYIPLTRSNGITQVLVGTEDGTFVRAGLDPDRPVLLAASPFLTGGWFRVTDANTVWEGNTHVEIFRVSYANGNGQITVKSSDGDKIIAPGTENSYTFALENTAEGPLDYRMSMQAYLSSDQYTIPVVAKVRRDTDHKYLLGSATEFENVLALDKVYDSGPLLKGYVMPYTLTWQWPFESGNDAYDTLLGNLEEDLTLTIVIQTYAEYAPPCDEGGVPKTGDTSGIGMWFTVMLGSAAGLMFLLLLRRKGENDEEA